MALNNQQIATFLKLVALVDQDKLDCDDCCSLIPEFVETESQPWTFTELTESVRTHLENCSCCSDECNNVREAVQEIQNAFT
ncbi:MAG: hypothetical protein ABJZ55_11840 [Fuerstiella sp.]